MFLARRLRRAKNNSGFNEHLSQLDIAIKGLIRTNPVVVPALRAGSTTGYGFYLLNPCYRAQDCSWECFTLNKNFVSYRLEKRCICWNRAALSANFAANFIAGYSSIDKQRIKCRVLKKPDIYSASRLNKTKLFFRSRAERGF